MPKTAPAEGERAGLGGYVRQYRDVAASLIYDRLIDSDEHAFEAVLLVDPNAGQIDDIQILSGRRHDAYQVKWTSGSGGVTLQSLTVGHKGTLSPLRQLYDAWATLRTGTGRRDLQVHWVTNAHASRKPEPKAFMGKGAHRPLKATMVAFLEEAHVPFVERATAVPARWRTTWASLRKAVRSPNEDTFADFMRACRFDLGYAPVNPALSSVSRRRREQHLRAIWTSLAGRVTDSTKGQTVEVSRDELLDDTGLGEGLRRNNDHDFPEPDIPVVDVRPTLEALHEAVNDSQIPYVGLIGPPGTGKSTALSAFARQRQSRGDVVVEYYAFTGEDDPTTTVRSESGVFLQDLVETFQRRGAGLKSIPGGSRTSLLNELHRQIHVLAERSRSDGSAVVLVIDGLDHVPRQRPSRGFLADLPLPSQLPEGVTVVVGSQTEQLDHLPAAVRDALSPGSPGRVETSLFDEDDVARVLAESGVSVALPEHAAATAWTKTKGYPLALALLVNRLRQARDAGDVELALEKADRPAGLYAEVWREVEHQHSVCHLLGLLARIPGSIDLVWISSWFEDASAVSFVFRRLRHLFRQEGDDRWHVFHDSFRVFLLEKTGAYMPGGWSVQLHAELAERAREAPVPHAWTELYHRDRAGHRDRVADLAQPHVAREQFGAFRPARSIAADLAAAGRHAADTADTPLFVAIAAAAEEVSRRQWAVDEYAGSPPLHLARYGRLAEAARLARSDRDLHVAPGVALYLAVDLDRGGHARDARVLYDLARPRRLLSRPSIATRDDVYLLRAWAHAAPRFELLHEVAAQISRLSTRTVDVGYEHRFDGQTDGEASHWLRRSLSLQVVRTLLVDEHWDDEQAWVRDHLGVALPQDPADPESADNAEADLQRQIARIESRLEAADALVAHDALAAAAERLVPFRQADDDAVGDVVETAGRNRAIQAARLLFETGATTDEVARWIPAPPEEARGGRWLGLDLEGSYSLVRLQHLLGLPLPTVPAQDDGDPREGVHRFRRGVLLLARLSVDARKGVRHSAEKVRDELLPLFSQIPNASHRLYREPRSWDGHMEVVQDRWWLYETAVAVAGEHGPPARDALLDALATQDTHPAPVIITGTYEPDAWWTARDVRAVARAASRAGAPAAWAQSFLEPLRPYAVGHDDLDTRTEELVALADAWSDVGDPDDAYQTFQAALSASFGVGYRKDYQLARIASLLGWLLAAGRDRLSDDNAARWTEHVARAVEVSVDGTETSQAAAAAQTLVGSVWAWRPQAALALSSRFLRATLVWEPRLTMEVLQAAVLDDPGAVALAADVLVHQVLPTRPQGGGLSNTYPEFTRLLVSQAAHARGLSPDTFAQDLCARIDALAAADTIGSQAEGWKDGAGEALRALGLGAVADDLGIKAAPQPATTLEMDDEVVHLEDTERKATWRELLGQVQKSGLPAVLTAFYTPEEVSVWAHTVEISATGLSRTAARETAAFVQGHPELGRVKVALALFHSLTAHGLGALAWEFGEPLVEQSRQHYDPWSPASSRSPALTAATELVEADPDGARPVLLRTLASEAAVRPGAVFPWLSSLLPLLEPRPDPAAHWRPVEDYLVGLVPSVSPDALEPPETTSPRLAGHAGLFRYVLSLLPDSTHAHRLTPTVRAELVRRHPSTHRAIAEALQGEDSIRRPLLRVLVAVAADRPDLLQPLLEDLRRAVPDLPPDLLPTGQHVLDRVQASVDADPTLAELMGLLDDEET